MKRLLHSISDMERVLVIGCPGSGKSTFARKLQEITRLPLCYLDLLFWNKDKTTVSKEEFDKRLDKVLQKDRWIIDGNYSRTMAKRLSRCDTVFLLDFDVDVCIDGITSRVGTERADMPWIETEVDEEFLQFVKDFKTQTTPKILSLLESAHNVNVLVFKNRSEADEYLNSLK